MHFIKREEVDPELPAALADRLQAVADGDGRYSLDAARARAAARRRAGTGCGRCSAIWRGPAVILPSPSSPDRVVGRMGERGFDRAAAAACRASVEEGARSRWRQYREIWAYVEGEDCRRRAILRHFGDHAEPAPSGRRRPLLRRLRQRAGAGAAAAARGGDRGPRRRDPLGGPRRPARRGRTTCAEILHGARTKKIERNSYDGLPAYGTSPHMRRADILARVDELIEAGVLATSGALPGAAARRQPAAAA